MSSASALHLRKSTAEGALVADHIAPDEQAEDGREDGEEEDGEEEVGDDETPRSAFVVASCGASTGTRHGRNSSTRRSRAT